MSKDKLADKFGITPITQTEVIEATEVIEISGNSGVDDDFEQAQQHVKNQIIIGQEAVQEMLELAKTSQSPRAFEVLAALLKTNKELAEAIMSNHINKNKAKGETPEKGLNTVNNNAIFCGSMKELLQTIKGKNE